MPIYERTKDGDYLVSALIDRENRPIKFTPTQRRIMHVLSDGLPHHRDEVLRCIDDPMASRSNVANHILLVRRKLRPLGHDIVCELYRASIYYRHIILLPCVQECDNPIS